MAPLRLRVSSIGVVLNAAMTLSDEEQLVARRVAGSLLAAGADLYVARSSPPSWVPGLPGRSFCASSSRDVPRAILGATLSLDGGATSQPPSVESAWLHAAGGHCDELVSRVIDARHDAVLIVGICSSLSVELARALGPKAVCLPLRTGPLEGLALTREALGATTGAIAVAPTEGRRLVEAGARLVNVVCVPLRGSTLDGARTSPLDRPYVLLTGDWSHPLRGGALRRRAARLGRQLVARTELVPVLLSSEFIYPDAWPRELSVHSASSRGDVQRWMQSSVAVVDLDRTHYLGRDAAEAMLSGAVPVVPVGSAAHDHVLACEGGLWYRHLDDIVAAVSLLAKDAEVRNRLAANGRTLAASRFSAVDRFEHELLETLSGQSVSRV